MTGSRNNGTINPVQEKKPFISAAVKRDLLMEAIGSRVFDHLRDPVTIETASRQMKIAPRKTDELLRVLRDMGIVMEQDGAFCNTREANAYFVSGNAEYLGAFLGSLLSRLKMKELSRSCRHRPVLDSRYRKYC
ncbi:MAG: hypothetical protein ABIK15_16775 [Pseudomonadota bacterium]